MDSQNITGWENSFQRQEEFLNDLFAEGNSISHETIGSKLVKMGILRESEKEIFLKHLNKKLLKIKEFKSNENQFIFICAQTKLNNESLHKAEGFINNGLNWNYIVSMAQKHRIAPLIYYNLQKIDKNNIIPKNVMNQLKKVYRTNADRNKLLFDELGNVLKAFKDAKIEIIVLKGAALAERVYGDIGLRFMNDIDILTKKTDTFRVEKKLLEMRHIQEDTSDVFNGFSSFLKEDRKSKIITDLHWTIDYHIPIFNINLEGLWKRAQPVTIARVKTLMLSPEDLLLHLCLHASHHHMFSFGLRHFCDISETIRHYDGKINWELLSVIAHQWGIGKYVFLMLQLTKELLGVAVPDAVLESLRPKNFDSQLVEYTKRQLLGTISDLSYPTNGNIKKFIRPNSLLEKYIFSLNVIKFVFPTPETLFAMYRIPPESKQVYFRYLSHWRNILSWCDRKVHSFFKN